MIALCAQISPMVEIAVCEEAFHQILLGEEKKKEGVISRIKRQKKIPPSGSNRKLEERVVHPSDLIAIFLSDLSSNFIHLTPEQKDIQTDCIMAFGALRNDPFDHNLSNTNSIDSLSLDIHHFSPSDTLEATTTENSDPTPSDKVEGENDAGGLGAPRHV